MNSVLINNEEEKQEIEYPCLMISKVKNRVVLMTGAGKGVSVAGADIGEYRGSWGMSYFKPLDPDAQIILSNGAVNPIKEGAKQDTQIRDKDLVWCWDDEYTYIRHIRFYDAENQGTFDYDGIRDGRRWEHYEKYQGEYPNWAKEAQKTLED